MEKMVMEAMIIGISGKKRHGKDTAAETIAAMLAGHAEICYFANGVKRGAAAILGLPPETFFDDVSKVKEYLIDFSNGVATTMSGREILQKLGTECVRDNIHPNFWVTRTMVHINMLEVPYVIIPDVRFPNEYDAVKNAGGVMIRVQGNPGEPADNHISETALDDHEFDAYIYNTGDYLSEVFINECRKACLIIENGGKDHVEETETGIQ